MNFRVNKPWLAQLRRMFVHCLLGFIPAMLVKLSERSADAAEKSLIHATKIEAPAPYLAVVGSPPLRFQAPPVIAMPDPTERKLKTSSEGSPPPVDSSLASSSPASSSGASKAAPTADKNAKPPEGSEPSIIKDELRPQVRPEQFLPFFQLPGPGSLPITPDVQPPLPPSTATYRQE